MKKFSLIVLCFLFISSSCQISIMTPRAEDDGTSKLNSNDSVRLFGSMVINDFTEDEKAYTIKNITADSLIPLFAQSRYTWIYVWATWCASCHSGIPYSWQYSQLLDSMNFIPVCTNYNFREMDKLYKEIDFYGLACILDASYYGTQEMKKLSLFGKEICPECPEFNAIPRQMIFNRRGELIYFQTGRVLDQDTLRSILN